ncbi:serine/threonine-protein kinase Nek11-like [Gastrophryne carolinensis]
MKRYCVQRKLGSGSFATTYLVTDSKQDGAQKVIKRIPCTNVKADATLPSAAEATLLGNLKHPFIVRFLGSFLETDDFCIVTEYCEGGDLHYHLQQQKDRGLLLSEGQIIEWFIQLLLGVNYLHESTEVLGCSHLGENAQRSIPCTERKKVKITIRLNGQSRGFCSVLCTVLDSFVTRSILALFSCDFGVSRVLVLHDLATTLTGTASYMSPEIFTGDGYNTKSDIWSLGCILYEMCTYRRAFDCPRWIKLVSMIVNDSCPDLPPRYSEELRDILQRMLTKDPNLRPSAKEILTSSYIAAKIQVLADWLQEVLDYDRQVSVNEDTARIAAAMQEKLHLDSLRVMREVQEMAPRQRRRIRQKEEPGMTKIKSAIERVYQEKHQKFEENKVSKKNAWADQSQDLSDADQRDLCSEEDIGEKEETYYDSLLTVSLPLSEQQSTMLSAYQSCLRRILDSSTESLETD